jgi:two-component sensor histidine kinase
MIKAFARLSTGIKMLLILSVALLPLGLIALFASIESAQVNRFHRETEARMFASANAKRVDRAIGRIAFRLKGALAAKEANCGAVARSMALTARKDIPLTLFAPDGSPICTHGRTGSLPSPPVWPANIETHLIAQRGAIVIAVAGPAGGYAIAELGSDMIGSIVRKGNAEDRLGIALIEGNARATLLTAKEDRPLEKRLTATAPLGGGPVMLEVTVSAAPITPIDLLMVLLPLLMWIAAAAIGWLVIERLVLSPLGQMQRAIDSYRPGQGPLKLPRLTTPAQEIRALGQAFANVTNDLASHEAELEQGLARQTRLTREVHHRVKNNLQVVSSLINLHARGASDPAVTAAYASIQRRVDALAVVHRNHYAELEENRGVGLRALIGELASNLRATATPEAAHMSITLDIMPAFATQDVAVPVAFLITEVVELVMACDPGGRTAISLHPCDTAGRALLTIDAPSLNAEVCAGHPSMDRFRRIIEGLARQLRAKLDHQEQTGRYTIEIGIVEENGRDLTV